MGRGIESPADPAREGEIEVKVERPHERSMKLVLEASQLPELSEKRVRRSYFCTQFPFSSRIQVPAGSWARFSLK